MSTQRSNIGALIAGCLLIGFGALALLGQLFRQFDFWGLFWPIIIIGVGAMLAGVASVHRSGWSGRPVWGAGRQRRA